MQHGIVLPFCSGSVSLFWSSPLLIFSLVYFIFPPCQSYISKIGRAYPCAHVCGGLKPSLSSHSDSLLLLIPPCSLVSFLTSHSSLAHENAAVKVKQQSSARLPLMPALPELKSPC